MTFRIGQKVVCIRSTNPWNVPLVEGAIYTVRQAYMGILPKRPAVRLFEFTVLWRKRHKPKKERVAMMAALYGMSFDPIIIVGASGNIPTPNLTTGPNGSASGENGISAALNADRNVSASSPFESGKYIPKITPFSALKGACATCHSTFAKISANWEARVIASGSPSVYLKLTRPFLVERTAVSLEVCSAERSRQETVLFNRSVSRRAVAARSFACAISALALAISAFAVPSSALAWSPWVPRSAIRSFDFLLSSAQCSSLTSVVFTMTNVERTPPRRLTNNVQLAIVPTNDAADKDISEKGHIKIPDWFYTVGIILVLVAGAIALFDQTKTLIRKVRQRRPPGAAP